MTTPGKFLPKPSVTTYDDGYVTELRPDGRVFVWYPKPQRFTVTFAVPECCPTCQRATASATVYEAMAI